MLTELEHQTIEVTAELAGLLSQVVGNGPTRKADLDELVGHLHNIQHAVMGQAAAREYPHRFRLLGQTVVD
jgi:hypothetical protein